LKTRLFQEQLWKNNWEIEEEIGASKVYVLELQNENYP
jgi:hypothetical protein